MKKECPRVCANCKWSKTPKHDENHFVAEAEYIGFTDDSMICRYNPRGIYVAPEHYCSKFAIMPSSIRPHRFDLEYPEYQVERPEGSCFRGKHADGMSFDELRSDDVR